MAMKPVILIVTGAWHIPEHYSLLSSQLRHRGYTVECPLHKTNNNAQPPNATLDGDIEQIRALANHYLEDGKDLVALMHSYGGIIGTSAFSGLGPNDRPGKVCVKALIYVCSFIPVEDESLAGIFGGALPPWLHPNDRGTIDVDNPIHHFYSDLAGERQQFWSAKLVCHPTDAQLNPPKTKVVAAWRTIPVTYLICDGDEALPPAVQEMMTSRIEEAGGLAVYRERCDASHSPFLSMPERVVEVVNNICEKVQRIEGLRAAPLL